MVAADAEPLLGVFGDPRVMAAFDAPPMSAEDVARWVARNLEHQERHGYGLYTIEELPAGGVIGDCGLERLEDGSGDVELGYDLRSDRWGRGLATEAAAAVRDHAFTALRIPRLVSLIRVGNARSERVALKIGMRHEADFERGGVRYRRFALAATRLLGSRERR